LNQRAAAAGPLLFKSLPWLGSEPGNILFTFDNAAYSNLGKLAFLHFHMVFKDIGVTRQKRILNT